MTALSETQLKILQQDADGLSTAMVNMLDKSLAWAMLVSCMPEPGIGTGLSLTIPAREIARMLIKQGTCSKLEEKKVSYGHRILRSKNHSSQSLLFPEPIMY